MNIITHDLELSNLCNTINHWEFIIIDTEFSRNKGYFVKLCLIQIASPEGEIYIVDPLSPYIDLTPLLAIFTNPKITKVFHSAKHDIEVIYQNFNIIPQPVFDTQIAAMVCGFGESVGYELLVRKLLATTLDKTSRFTDWAARPLSNKQLEYAASDVIYLGKIYKKLLEILQKNGRTSWLSEEFNNLIDPVNYQLNIDKAWHKLRVRSNSPPFIELTKELVRWRELKAQQLNVSASKILKGDILLEVASSDLDSSKTLDKVQEEFREELYNLKNNFKYHPKAKVDDIKVTVTNNQLFYLLKLLLKIKSEEHGVVGKIIASETDLKKLCSNLPQDELNNLPILKGWQYQVFGQFAIDLKNGKTAIAYLNRKIQLVKLEE